jgi:hypothetical protein
MTQNLYELALMNFLIVVLYMEDISLPVLILPVSLFSGEETFSLTHFLGVARND